MSSLCLYNYLFPKNYILYLPKYTFKKYVGKIKNPVIFLNFLNRSYGRFVLVKNSNLIITVISKNTPLPPTPRVAAGARLTMLECVRKKELILKILV